MGAWGCGNFENDESRDWLASARAVPRADWAVVAAALANANSRETSDEVRALAAAEVVAAASGHAGGRIPVEAVELAANLGQPMPAILSEAQSVAQGLLADSELRLLFEDDPEWRREMEDLNARLSSAQQA
jgi:hypothetical protein